MKTKAALFTAALMLAAAAAKAEPVRTERAACNVVKTRVAAVRGFPTSSVAYCDVIPPDGSPAGLYVLALHSNRRCDGICSTTMGWFAVQRATGRVFEWDVAEDRLGPPVGTGR